MRCGGIELDIFDSFKINIVFYENKSLKLAKKDLKV